MKLKDFFKSKRNLMTLGLVAGSMLFTFALVFPVTYLCSAQKNNSDFVSIYEVFINSKLYKQIVQKEGESKANLIADLYKQQDTYAKIGSNLYNS